MRKTKFYLILLLEFSQFACTNENVNMVQYANIAQSLQE